MQGLPYVDQPHRALLFWGDPRLRDRLLGWLIPEDAVDEMLGRDHGQVVRFGVSTEFGQFDLIFCPAKERQ